MDISHWETSANCTSMCKQKTYMPEYMMWSTCRFLVLIGYPEVTGHNTTLRMLFTQSISYRKHNEVQFQLYVLWAFTSPPFIVSFWHHGKYMSPSIPPASGKTRPSQIIPPYWSQAGAREGDPGEQMQIQQESNLSKWHWWMDLKGWRILQ